MSRKTIGMILLVAGVIIALAFGFADVIGIGRSDPGIFGWQQLLGLLVGAAVGVIGLVMMLGGKAPATDD